MTATVHVCIGCRDHDPALKGAGLGGGTALLAALAETMAGTGIDVRPAPCLGACRGGGRVVLENHAKWGWLIEGIDTAADRAALAVFIRAWHASPNGRVAKPDRPQWTEARILGRYPPAAPQQETQA
jgi:predicted metal-binding protein